MNSPKGKDCVPLVLGCKRPASSQATAHVGWCVVAPSCQVA